jgi:hypothetical protein
MDPFTAALITWATGRSAAASLRALGRTWKGDPQSNALATLARQSVASCVKAVVPPSDADAVAEALLRDDGAATRLRVSDVPDLRHAILAALGERLEVLAEQWFDIDSESLADCLATKITVGIMNDAARGGVLKPLAERVLADQAAKMRERGVDELSAIRSAMRFDRQALIAAGTSEGISVAPERDAAFSLAHSSALTPDFLFSTDFWLGRLQSDFADQLLDGSRSATKNKDSPLFDLDRLVTQVFGIDGLSVAIRMESEPITVPVSTSDEFWAALLADLALLQDRPGNMRWLLKKTISGEGHRVECGRIQAVWDCISHKFLSSDSGAHREDLLRRLVNASLETARRDRRKGQLRFLLDLVTNDANLRLIFRSALEDFCRAHSDLSYQWLSDLLYLIGDVTDDLERANPDLVLIKPTGRWQYEFEVMRRPLTVRDARALSPGVLGGMRGNGLLPFRFLPRDRFRSHGDFYDNLRKELMTIVRLISSQADKASGLRWDVPTYCEWLRLAGCESQRFPWGDKFEQGRANLRIEGDVARIRPVGSFPGGASRHGVDDCCGNVHEMVRWGDGFEVPSSFGLIGHSYRTPPNLADCRNSGKFKPRTVDDRWNIGIRLIRYKGSDEDKRMLRTAES